jgi:hypothetical protein
METKGWWKLNMQATNKQTVQVVKECRSVESFGHTLPVNFGLANVLKKKAGFSGQLLYSLAETTSTTISGDHNQAAQVSHAASKTA